MAVPKDREMVYRAGDQEIKLTPGIVKNYLVNGNGNVSDREIVEFMSLCKYQGLNPFLRDAYLIKYGSQDATIVTGKDFFMKRARSAPDMEGFRAGIIVGDNGQTEETEGFVPEGKKVVGGWAEVYIKGWKYPVKVQVCFNEYVGRKRDGSFNRMWKEKPATMIRKCALVQALREAFPGLYGGLYSPEEINTVDSTHLADQPIDVEPEPELGNGNGQDNGQDQEQPKYRSRRNVQQVEDMEIKTCGITGEALADIKRMRNEHPEAVRPLIHETLDRLEIQDITFLRADEGEQLVRQVVTAISQPAQEPQDSEPPPNQGEGMPPATDGTQAPPDVDWGDNAAPPEPKEDEIECPTRGKPVSPKLCANRCENRERCQIYQEHLYEQGES